MQSIVRANLTKSMPPVGPDAIVATGEYVVSGCSRYVSTRCSHTSPRTLRHAETYGIGPDVYNKNTVRLIVATPSDTKNPERMPGNLSCVKMAYTKPGLKYDISP